MALSNGFKMGHDFHELVSIFVEHRINVHLFLPVLRLLLAVLLFHLYCALNLSLMIFYFFAFYSISLYCGVYSVFSFHFYNKLRGTCMESNSHGLWSTTTFFERVVSNTWNGGLCRPHLSLMKRKIGYFNLAVCICSIIMRLYLDFMAITGSNIVV